jgi:hypothetical protein
MASHFTAPNDGTTLQVSRAMLYGMAAGFTSLVGTVFWTAGYAVGLRSGALLATLFVMGASSALLVLVLWLMSQVPGERAQERDAGDEG